MKKTLIVLSVVFILFCVTGCKKNHGLVVWSFTDEMGQMIDDYYTIKFPDVNITYSVIETEQFESRLDSVLTSRRRAPDVFTLEAASVRKYAESGFLMDLTDIYERNRYKLLAYPVEIGTYDGRVYGMSLQVCPGAMFYRRSIAKQYLGSDNPDVVQAYFSDINKLIDTAEILKQRSGGNVVVTANRGDLYYIYLAECTQPWIVNNNLVIDPVMEAYMDMCKIFHENRYDGNVDHGSDDWFAGMKDELKDEAGTQLQVFSYFLPVLDLHNVLKTNAESTAGDWAMIPGPAPYHHSGTWIGAWKNSKNPEGVKHMIEWLTTDDGFLEAWAKDTGNMISNITVINEIKDSYEEPFLGGQNYYAVFVEIALDINGRLIHETDQVIEDHFKEAVTAYVEGNKTKQQALADFKQQVHIRLGLN
jgi:ABC-type glycerol-3-phosphate transport system substrate-binding protein